MMQIVEKKPLLAVAGALVLFITASASEAKKEPRLDDPRMLLKREETMVINLNKGPKSTGFYILTSLKAVRNLQKDLDRAARQVEQVDAQYAKMTGKPDDRSMASTLTRLQDAQKSADALEQQLESSYTELKSDIKTTLIKQR